MNKYVLLGVLLLLIINNYIKAQDLIKATEQVIDTTIFTKVDEEATYPGGVEAWTKYLSKSLSPSIPEENAPNGKYKVIIRFMIDKDGNLTDVTAETNYGYGMEKEGIRVIASSGKWLPAIKNGKPIKAFRRQPLTFMVEDGEIEFNTEIPYVLYTNEENMASIKINNKIVDNIELTSTGATIVNKGEGKFSITPNATGRILISVMKKNKNIGNFSFELRKR